MKYKLIRFGESGHEVLSEVESNDYLDAVDLLLGMADCAIVNDEDNPELYTKENTHE